MRQALGFSLAVLLSVASATGAAELPANYFRLMDEEVKSLQPETLRTPNNGAMLAAAVLFKKQDPANPRYGDNKLLELALKLGDLAASAAEKDMAEDKQENEWEIHFWLDSFRLLEANLGAERRARWQREIETIVNWFARATAGRIDFPRYQGPFIHTSTNHLALFASTVYLAGRVLPNKEWEALGARALHRLAAEEQTADGYWGEFTNNGPATGYNYLTFCCVALYWEHSHDPAALTALRRATDFHTHFTWPNGTPVETINGRNRHWAVSPWGHFGFTHWPDGRRYAEFLTGIIAAGKVSGRDLGRLSQSALYCHEGPTAPIPHDLARSSYQMKVPAGIRKTGPWTVCLSGLIDAPIDSQFTLDRQAHLSIYHDKLGLIVTGANSKQQPELATFMDRTKDRLTTIPFNSRLRMSDERDRLGLAYQTFFAEAEVPTPVADRLPFRFSITETSRGKAQDAQLNLQLCLKAGEALETATTRLVLSEKRIELKPEEIGGWIRHHGWTLRVDSTARLTWPIYPFNPYRNAPETGLQYAVGALTVPVRVQPPAKSGLNWRTQDIPFTLEVNAPTSGGQSSSRSSPPEFPGDRAIRKYLSNQAAQLERELLPDLKTAADFERARPTLRNDFLDMLGLKPLPERTPLNATVTGRLERDGYTVEKLHLQSRPGLYVTADLYLPRPAKGPYPAILYQCGHASQMKRDGTKADANHQSHAIWFATHGYVALVVDTLELGEIASVHRGTLSQGRWWWYSAGYTPAGVECWNAVRALDYLVSRPEVDPDRIGATGISGGGVGTFWIAAADERIKAAAPVSGMGDLTFYVGDGGIGRHCDCFSFPNRARWNWTTIAALICPRPLLFVNSDNDVYFPMSPNERIANRLQRLYAPFGAGDQTGAVISVGGHGYRTDVRRAVFEFFNRHFKGDGRRVTDGDVAEVPRGKFPIDPRELRVFPTDADLPTDQVNTRIDETFVTRARPELPAADSIDAWRRDLLNRLRKVSFAAWPARPSGGSVHGLGSQPAEGRETTEDGIEVSWRWLPGPEADGKRWLIVLNPGEEMHQKPEWSHDLVKTGSVMLLCPRGVGPGAWTRDVFPNAVERSFPLLGGTSDGGRVWDVMTVARRHADPKSGWRVAGQGSAGIVAAYAALYEPAIAEVAAVNPPPSHQPRLAGAAYGPSLLNVLRVLDIPEALGCLAPRRLTLIGASDAAFDRTAALYRLAGAADRLERNEPRQTGGTR